MINPNQNITKNSETQVPINKSKGSQKQNAPNSAPQNEYVSKYSATEDVMPISITWGKQGKLEINGFLNKKRDSDQKIEIQYNKNSYYNV